MGRPRQLPIYDAAARAALECELKDVGEKLNKLRVIRMGYTKVWRNAYIRHRMRVSRGVVTAEHVAELATARATYERLSGKWHVAAGALMHKRAELKRAIGQYQKAALYT